MGLVVSGWAGAVSCRRIGHNCSYAHYKLVVGFGIVLRVAQVTKIKTHAHAGVANGASYSAGYRVNAHRNALHNRGSTCPVAGYLGGLCIVCIAANSGKQYWREGWVELETRWQVDVGRKRLGVTFWNGDEHVKKRCLAYDGIASSGLRGAGIRSCGGFVGGGCVASPANISLWCFNGGCGCVGQWRGKDIGCTTKSITRSILVDTNGGCGA